MSIVLPDGSPQPGDATHAAGMRTRSQIDTGRRRKTTLVALTPDELDALRAYWARRRDPVVGAPRGGPQS